MRFIFSHSALREGWDNPNVFQICTLSEMGCGDRSRQTIGRGLRLRSTETGDARVPDRESPSYCGRQRVVSEFAKSLQTEYEKAGVEIGRVRPQEFSKIPLFGSTSSPWPDELFGFDRSNALYEHTRERGIHQGRQADA